MKLKTRVLLVLVTSVSIFACTKKSDDTAPIVNGTTGPNLPKETYNYLANSQLSPGSLNLQLSNDIITLGRVLFYDKALSFNSNMSCGSCHFQDKGFADNVRFHKGVFGNTLKRNTMSISGNGVLMFWDGRANSMKDLVLRPIANHDEMVQDPNALVNKIKQLSYYNELFTKAYGPNEIDLANIENALAAFCVALLPSNTKFNIGLQAVSLPFGFNEVDTTVNLFNLSAVENQGLKLFFGKARCGTCHHPEEGGSTYGGSSPTPFANIGLDLVYSDNGLGALVGNANLNGKFKVPNIKNVALTAPYMHDGRFNTLEEVVEHYNSGMKPNPNLSPKLFQNPLSDVDIFLLEEQSVNPNAGPITPAKLGLTIAEKAALVAFLKTLTDEQLARDIKFSNPF